MEQQAAYARFVAREHPRLVRALTVYTGDADIAPDLAADALERAAQHWSRVVAMDAPGAWVHRVAINTANSWYRRRAALHRARARAGPDEAVQRDQDTPDVLAVRGAVAALPQRRRACVVLHHLAGLDTDEVAAALGITPATVRSHLRHAHTDLRAALGEAPPTSGRVEAPRPATPAADDTEAPR